MVVMHGLMIWKTNWVPDIQRVTLRLAHHAVSKVKSGHCVRKYNQNTSNIEAKKTAYFLLPKMDIKMPELYQ